MKKILTMRLLMAVVTLLLTVAMVSCGSDENENLITEQVTVDVQTPGTLASLIGSEKVYKITNLKIKGTLNADDISFIHYMAGEIYCPGKVAKLDISEVQFVESEVSQSTYSYYVQRIEGGVDICDNMFWGCLELVSIKLPNTSYIGEYAFGDCESLKNIVFPSTVKTINEGAFYHCDSLTAISLPKGLTTIGKEAFRNSGITTITIPLSVKEIGSAAFLHCEKLKDVYVKWSAPISISEANPFVDVSAGRLNWSLADQDCTLHIPKGTYQNYWNSEWSTYFRKIVED